MRGGGGGGGGAEIDHGREMDGLIITDCNIYGEGG